MRICFVGDSFVNGTGDPEFLGWTGRLCRQLRNRVPDLTAYNLGVRRDTSSDIRARWREEAVRRLPPGVDGRLLFAFGVNDCLVENGRQRLEPALSLANARAILEQVITDWPTLMVGPPPIADEATNRRIGALCAALNELAWSMKVPYIATFEDLITSATWVHEARAGDGAHPGAGGYDALARVVASSPAWNHWIGSAVRSN